MPAKKAKKKKVSSVNHGRARGETQISLSIPISLLKEIDSLAAAENRNRSNFISTSMEKVVEEME